VINIAAEGSAKGSSHDFSVSSAIHRSNNGS
jgi:hypothetical protein